MRELNWSETFPISSAVFFRVYGSRGVLPQKSSAWSVLTAAIDGPTPEDVGKYSHTNANVASRDALFVQLSCSPIQDVLIV
jgi:hypothetical protein